MEVRQRRDKGASRCEAGHAGRDWTTKNTVPGERHVVRSRKFEKAGFNSERAWLASAWPVSEASAYTGLTLTNELSQVCPRLIVLSSQ